MCLKIMGLGYDVEYDPARHPEQLFLEGGHLGDRCSSQRNRERRTRLLAWPAGVFVLSESMGFVLFVSVQPQLASGQAILPEEPLPFIAIEAPSGLPTAILIGSFFHGQERSARFGVVGGFEVQIKSGSGH